MIKQKQMCWPITGTVTNGLKIIRHMIKWLGWAWHQVGWDVPGLGHLAHFTPLCKEAGK